MPGAGLRQLHAGSVSCGQKYTASMMAPRSAKLLPKFFRWRASTSADVHKPFRHAALITDDDHAKSRIHSSTGNRSGDAGEKAYLFPSGDVLAFGRLDVNYAITIEKRCFVHERSHAPQAVRSHGRSGCGTPECGEFPWMAHRYSRSAAPIIFPPLPPVKATVCRPSLRAVSNP